MSDIAKSEASIASESSITNKYVVPVLKKDISVFDGAYTFMKQRFAEEMRRIDEEMTKFSSLLLMYGEMETYNSGAGIPKTKEIPASTWASISNSPLIEGEGDDKMLRLQFDVSHFEPDEVVVKIFDDKLVVSAQHCEKTDTSNVYNEYHREFTLPPNTDPGLVESELSQDGILTVKAPLHLAVKASCVA